MVVDNRGGGRGSGGPKTAPAGPAYLASSGSPRNPIPDAVCRILVLLIEELEDMPSETRVELRNILARLRRVYKLPAQADATELAWEHEDGPIPE